MELIRHVVVDNIRYKIFLRATFFFFACGNSMNSACATFITNLLYDKQFELSLTYKKKKQ